MKPLAMLVPYVLRYKPQLAGAGLALLLAAAATLVVPLAVRRMIDHGFNAADGAAINTYFIALIGVVAVLATASSLRFYFVTWLGERVVADLRADVFRHIATLGIDFFDRNRSGEITARLTTDTTQIKAVAGANVSIALRNLVMFVGAIAMMVVTSPSLSGLVLVALPIVVLPLVGFGRRIRARSRRAQDMLADASAYASEAIGAMRVVQAFTAEGSVTARFTRAVETAFVAARNSTAARAALTAFGIFMVFSSMVAVLWWGAQDVLAGRMTPGTLGQFLIYAVIGAGALGELSQVWGDIANASGAAERLSEILVETPSVSAPARPQSIAGRGAGAIAFEAVTFAYPEGGREAAIREISFTIAPGERVAVVGPSGAGKSTLFNLILRFYDPQSGRVTFDGIDAKALDPLALRQRIALVPQDTVIFAATAAENIGFGRPDASVDDVRQAAKAAYADDFLSALPKGYETELGERGVTLSGGQRQRLAIARAILKDAPVLLLDEATSALDAESEVAVQAALDELMVGRTTIVIAHRLATILKADRILVMDGGTIVEEGTHEELSRQGGLYARLARLQFRQDAA
ncbi:ABC transporter transmembrane domain-containing protein [Kaistia dalseonensis]|uniref:ATP-binding cassette subfamily B protein n=1 Tax=Kaistia dalseonensis TaxID=410840 RepID=A0ABU0HA40_9HYPH|nr:ABC transporter transmembrane domain-containing protein [Kaistia dalseonensis]MCX5496566.1 ABC transporter transmembrane domain-containing protein [Kaistia dalseonensis]MDQ0439188.1 ATP-binding cassette subfamily B protein [Kaistia dalseonensis]